MQPVAAPSRIRRTFRRRLPKHRRAVEYDDGIVRMFIVATLFWGVVGMAMGVLIAAQMVFPALNLDLPWTTFGRLRPVHTSGVIFAFGGNALIGTSLYCVQRTCRARLPGRFAAEFVFWGYQLFIVLAALGYVMGVTQAASTPSPSGRGPVAGGGVADLSAASSSACCCAGRSRTSTWRTGSTWPSSSPSRCCTW